MDRVCQQELSADMRNASRRSKVYLFAFPPVWLLTLTDRNEVSLHTLLHNFKRIESKLSDITAKIAPTVHETATLHFATQEDSNWSNQLPVPNAPSEIEQSISQGSPMTGETLKSYGSIPFSAHQILFWPAVDSMLPDAVKTLYESYGKDYATILESERPALSVSTSNPDQSALTSRLTISVIKGLSDVYFSTFNLANPILDKIFYYRHTLGVAINGNFGFDIESCVVLTVMALGCFGQKALAEVGFRQSNVPPSSPSASSDDSQGLGYFNEARKRIGYLMCDNSLQNCQYYLLAA